MLKTAAAAIFAIALLSLASAADGPAIEIEKPGGPETYVTTGSLAVKLLIRNPSMYEVRNIVAAVTPDDGSNIIVTSKTAISSLHPNEAEELTIYFSGMPKKTASVGISVSGTNPSNSVQGDTLTIYISPIEPDMGIEYPRSEIKLVGVPENGSTSFSVVLKNTGEIRLVGVYVNLTFDGALIDCTWDSEKRDIEKAKSEAYAVSCSNVNTGDRVSIAARDSQGAVAKFSSTTFRLVASIGPNLNASIVNMTGGPAYATGSEPVPIGANGAWPMFRGGPMRAGYTNWTGDIGEDFKVSWTYTLPGGAFGSPAAADLNNDSKLEIIVPLSGGEGIQKNLVALRADGSLMWDFSSAGSAYSSPAAGDLDNDTDLDVVYGTNAGKVIALEGRTGKMLWSFDQGSGWFRSSPLVYDGDGDNLTEVYIGSDKGVYALNGSNGAVKWMYPTTGEVSSSPAIGELDGYAGLEIAFGSEEGVLYVLSAGGSLSWYKELDESIVYSTPAITDNKQAIIGSEKGTLFTVTKSSVSKYAAGASIYASPAAVNESGRLLTVFGTSMESDVHGVSQPQGTNLLHCADRLGTALWKADLGGRSLFSSPSLADIDRDGNIEALVGDTSGRLFSVDLSTGKTDWSYDGGVGLFSSPALADVDGDGDLEIIVAYRTSGQVKLIDSVDKPDLKIESMSFSNEFPKEGENITITVSLANSGKLPSANTSLSLFRRSPLLDLPIGNATIRALSPGERISLNLTWQASFPDANIGIYAKADPDNLISESNEFNNGIYMTFGADLVLSSCAFPEAVLASSKKAAARVKAVILNKGMVSANNVRVSLTVDNGTGALEVGSKVINIGAGNEASAEIEFAYAPSNASRNLSVVVDSGGAIAETDESNNRASFVIRPYAKEKNPAAAPVLSSSQQNDNTLMIALLGFVVVIVFAKAFRRNKGTKEGKKKKGKEKKEEPPPEDYEKELEGDQLSYVSNMPELPKPISIQ